MDDKNIKIHELPKNILDYCENILNFYPSVIETGYYSIDALKIILSKNKLLWSNKFFDGLNIIYNNGLIEFKDSEIFFYFVKRENETTYKLYVLSKEDSTDSIIYYLNQLKKFKTIS